MDLLPERVECDELTLRCYAPPDAEALVAAVTASIEHLRPWMPWIADEPQSVEQRRWRIQEWAAERAAGGAVTYGIFAGDELVGGTGFHRRSGPDTLEIGYWVHVAWTGRGVATAAAGRLTTVALAHPGIEHVEIVHDRRNRASERVPVKLGYRLVEEYRRAPQAPAESGWMLRWRCSSPAAPSDLG